MNELDDLILRARDETASIQPPPDFAATVLAATMTRRSPSRTTAELGALARFAVPIAAIAAAAAIALAWTTGGALDASGEMDLDSLEAAP